MKLKRVGILIPWVNITLEDELGRLIIPEIGLHWSRIEPKIYQTMDMMKGILIRLFWTFLMQFQDSEILIWIYWFWVVHQRSLMKSI